MRPDQIVALQVMQEKLADHFLSEADPDMWPGAGIAPADMDKSERGDQFWCKKNAMATIALVGRIQVTLAQERDGVAAVGDDGEPDLDEQQKAREKEAQKLMREVMGRMSAKP